ARRRAAGARTGAGGEGAATPRPPAGPRAGRLAECPAGRPPRRGAPRAARPAGGGGARRRPRGRAPAGGPGPVRPPGARGAGRAVRQARREVEAVAARLDRAGWAARAIVLAGIPLPALLDVVASDRADLLALGARGVGGITRMLLGSVAEGALTRAPVPVLV